MQDGKIIIGSLEWNLAQMQRGCTKVLKLCTLKEIRLKLVNYCNGLNIIA